MWHFDGENKPGFAKYTPGVYLAYSWCTLAKIYRIGYELFGAIKQGKKLWLFLLQILLPAGGGALGFWLLR